MTDTRTENDAVIEIANAAANLDNRIGYIGGVPVGAAPNGDLVILDKAIQIANARMPHPRRRRGHTKHTTAESLIHYTNTYGGPNTCLWAQAEDMTVRAIYDYHGPGPDVAGWQEHQATYACPTDPRWRTWAEACSKLLTQDQFGELVDENLEDLVATEGGPKPLDVLELSRSLRVEVAERYERKVNPATGEYDLIAKRENGATSTTIPRAFGLAIPVFVGGAKYAVECRIRLRMDHGSPRFVLTMHRAEEIKSLAFDEVVELVATKTGRQVFAGSPGAPNDSV